MQECSTAIAVSEKVSFDSEEDSDIDSDTFGIDFININFSANTEDIEVELREVPTLKEIEEKTYNFTLFEKEKGFLYRTSYEDYDPLNSKLLCKIRYLLQEERDNFPFISEKECYEIIKNIIEKAYSKYGEKDDSFDFVLEKDSKPGTCKFSLFINNSPFNEIVVFDIYVDWIEKKQIVSSFDNV